MSRDLHPIQLEAIKVIELSLQVTDPNGLVDDALEGVDLPFTFFSGNSEFDESSSSISIGVAGQVGDTENGTESTLPFDINVKLLGLFSVDAEKFPMDKLDHWAKHNAPLILLPFLREHIYGLASRAGIKNVVVPLFTVPTIKVSPQENS